MVYRSFIFLGITFCLSIGYTSSSYALDNFDKFSSNFGEIVYLQNSKIDDEQNLDKSQTSSDDLLLANLETKKSLKIDKQAGKDSTEKQEGSKVVAIEEEKTNDTNFVEASSFLSADFFADSLSQAYTIEDDPMGTQRLLQVRNSTLAPSVLISSSYNYSSNPEKVANPTKKDGTSFNLSLTFNLGLGEYGLGEEVICAPALSFVKMRTFTDPFHDFGNQMTVYDLDTQIASLSMPFVMPNDFSLTLSNSYVVPSTFRGKKKIISYSNTPSLTLTKNFLLDSGDTVTFNAGLSYTFSEGDTLEQQINDPVYYSFIEAVMQQSGLSPTSDYPSNLQDGLGHALSISYTKPIGESLTFVPSLAYQSTSFTKGANTSRVDKTYNVGLSVSQIFTEWLNFTGLVNYSWKRTNDDLNTPEFEDFLGGVSINVNHSF